MNRAPRTTGRAMNRTPAHKKGAPPGKDDAPRFRACPGSAAADLAALNLSAKQRARRCAEHGAGGSLAARVDRPPDERAGSRADDQPDGAVGALAAIAAVAV